MKTSEGEHMLQLGEQQKQLLEDLEYFFDDRYRSTSDRETSVFRIAAALGLEKEFKARINHE